jgi:O-antigen biosynthesis protein
VRLVYRALSVWKNEGLLAVVTKSARKITRKASSRGVLMESGVVPADLSSDQASARAFAEWIAQNEPSTSELNRQRRSATPCQPKISLAVPAYNTPLPFLKAMIESVLEQTYANWELCIVDGASQDPAVQRTLEAYSDRDSRIRAQRLSQNFGIAGNSNRALELATGEFIALLDHDDTLAPFALFELATAINQYSDADLIYSDEDKIDSSGETRSQPHFKPDFSPDTLRSHNYICHLSCFRRDLLDALGGFRMGFDGSQDYDLILRAVEQARRIVHLPKILYHWRMHEASCAMAPEAKLYAYDSASKALNQHLERCGLQGRARVGRTLGVYEVSYDLRDRPLVSIIICNKDNCVLLERCLKSISNSTYANYEIVVVENSSSDFRTHDYYAQIQERPNIRVIEWEKPFNYSAMNNFGVENARGDVLLFLNNDIEAINNDWMRRLLEHALRPDVGGVGAKLYYPDDTVQHAGVILGLGGVAGHAHLEFPRSHYGYFGRLITTQNLSAVTAACLMMRRHVFEEVGGFDPRYAISFNDVDLCVRIRKQGYLIVWTPFAELYHYESATRGRKDSPEKNARFALEEKLFATDWADALNAGDPYYNRGLTLELPDFSLRLQPERPRSPADLLLKNKNASLTAA